MIKITITVVDVDGECAVNVTKDRSGEDNEVEDYLARVAEIGALTALQIEAERQAKHGTKVDMISVPKGSDIAKAYRKKYGV